MPLVPAKCTSCGGTLEVDSAQQAAICKYCGSAFVVEQAINNYNVTNVTNISSLNAGVVNLNSGESADELSSRADTFISLKEFDRANECYVIMREKFPADPRGWAGKIRIITKDYVQFTISLDFLEDCLDMYDKFIAVSKQKGDVDKAISSKIQMVIDQLITALEKKHTDFENGRLAELKQISDDAIKKNNSFDPNSIEEAKKISKAKGAAYKRIHSLIVSFGVIVALFILIFDLSRFIWLFENNDFFNSLRNIELGLGYIFKPIMFFALSCFVAAALFGLVAWIDKKIYKATAKVYDDKVKSLEEEQKELKTAAYTKAAEFAVEQVPHEKNAKRLESDKELYSQIKSK